MEVVVLGSSTNFIDTQIRVDSAAPWWRFTGYYGFPERRRRREAWQLLCSLANLSSLPWVIMGDFNDLLDATEKRGRAPHPSWCLRGFQEVVRECGLVDLCLEGCPFTWERGRGTSGFVQEKLDRIMVSGSWLELYGDARAFTVAGASCDHMAVCLSPERLLQRRRGCVKRFKFENVWLREEGCREIKEQSWRASQGKEIQTRVASVGAALWRWGRGRVSGFASRIE